MIAAVAQPEPLAIAMREIVGEGEARWVASCWSRCAKKLYNTTAMGRGMVAVGPHPDHKIGPTPLFMDERLLFRAHCRLVDELLSRSTVLVATLLVDPDPIGWAAYEGDTLHYVYVAPAARRCSVARQLALATRCHSVSHVTPEGMRLARCVRGEARAT